MFILKILLLFTGLIPLAIADARAQSVPLVPCDAWTCTCVVVGLLMDPTHTAGCFLLGSLLGAFCLLRGLGSADLLVLLAICALWGLTPALVCLLIAAGSGIVWTLVVTHAQRLALLPHILVGVLACLPFSCWL